MSGADQAASLGDEVAAGEVKPMAALTGSRAVKMVKLGDVADINPRDISVSSDDSVSFVGMAELDSQTAEASQRKSCKFSTVATGYTVFQNGDILAAKITPCWENGKVGQAKLDHEIGVGSTEFHIVRPNYARLNPRYLLRFLRQPWIRETGELRMAGSAGQKRVPASFIANLDMPLPPLGEQRRIAEILDRADEIRAKRRQQLAHLDDLTQAIFHDMFGDPRDWGQQWKLSTIGELAESIQYGTSAKSKDRGSFPILRMGNLTDQGRIDLEDLKYTELREEEIPKYTLKPGDLLFNRTNSKEKVGKAAVVRTDKELAYAGYLVRVRFPETTTAEFVSAYLRSPAGVALRRKLAKTAVNQANISAKEMAAIRVPVLPIDLRHQFAQALGIIKRQREVIECALTTDDELFASLQGCAFTC